MDKTPEEMLLEITQLVRDHPELSKAAIMEIWIDLNTEEEYEKE